MISNRLYFQDNTLIKLFTAKTLRRILIAIPITFVAIQLIPVDRTNPPVQSEISAPPEVRAILRKACYDCHSNETTWPWYSKVAPVSWLVASDVHEGREELNFSTWSLYTKEQQIKKLKESWDEIVEGEMPPWIFLLNHQDAALTATERELFHTWVLDSMKVK